MVKIDLTQTPFESEADRRKNVRIGNRLQRIARVVEKEFQKIGLTPQDVQFSLIVWGPGRMQYVSNAERKSVIEAMREMLQHWENGAPDLGKPELPPDGATDN